MREDKRKGEKRIYRETKQHFSLFFFLKIFYRKEFNDDFYNLMSSDKVSTLVFL